MDKRSDSARKNYILVTVISAAALVIAMFLFAVQNGRRITSENREYLVDNASQVAESIDAALSDGYANIKILSELVSKSLTGPEFNIASIQGLIKDSVFDFMEFADKDGMDHNITGGVSDARDRQYYLDAKAGNTGMELIYVSRATHETLLMFYSPIYYENEFVGSLVGVYQAANRITKLLSSEYFGESATAYLATDNGRIIASNQGFDPQNEMYAYDLSRGDPELRSEIDSALGAADVFTFSMEGNDTGGCMQRLPGSGWYLIQIFPPQASRRMIGAANALGYRLVGFLVLVYVLILLSLIRFYRSQQKEVEEARNQAEIANRAKTSFLFNMSHDIRTPMNAIMGFTGMALKHIGDEAKVRDCLTKTQSAGNMLLSLINNILDVSRIESGNAKLDEKPAMVSHSFDNIDVVLYEMARRKDIDLAFSFGEVRDDYILCDIDRFNRIITNIISNALKYTREGGRVKVRCEQVGEAENGFGTYRYTVEDNGIGMSEEFQKHVFDRFSREENSTVSGVQGSGLGMAVVKSFVELMNGTVECSSRQGVGTTFTVTIPIRLQNLKETGRYINPYEDLDGRSSSEGGGHETAGFAGTRVLLVEDNEMNREIADDILEDMGIIADNACDGSEAVRILRERGPAFYDIVFMDIQMPVMNGYEATKTIREMYPGENIPIIALSANAFAEDREASIKIGMNDHLAKPVNAAALKAVMAKYTKQN